jgi:hypothetical protein
MGETMKARALFRLIIVLVAVVGTLSGLQTITSISADAQAPALIAGTYTALTPARVLDTRLTAAVGPNAAVSMLIGGKLGVPAIGVSAVVLNVTVSQAQAAGYITVYPTGNLLPTASNLNFGAGQDIPNLVVVPLGTGGKVSLYNGSAGSTHLIADIEGYYLSGTVGSPGAFSPLNPFRLLDTRDGTGGTLGPVGAYASVTVPVAGHHGVPSTGVSAVILNVTVVQPQAAGWVTALPSGGAIPTASNLNFAAGQNVPNLVVVPLGSDGNVALSNGSGAPLHLLADIEGYFLTGQPGAVGAFGSLNPARILDTRYSSPVGAQQTLAVQIAGQQGVPAAGVSAVVLNITVTAPQAGGWITAYPHGGTLPTASNLNFLAGQDIPNLVTVPLGADGKVSLFNGSSGSTHLIADVEGYYLSDGWGPPQVVDRTQYGMPAISCVSSTFCMAIDGNGDSGEVSSLQWKNRLSADPNGLTTVSCATSTFCMALDYYGNPIKYSTGQWATPTPTGTYTNWEAISCASATFCAAVDDVHGLRQYNGTSWSQASVNGSTTTATVLSCPTNSFCAAVNEDETIIFDGTSWTATANTFWRTSAVSCTSSTFCIAADTNGNVKSYDGTSWTFVDEVVPSFNSTQVSCVSSTFCLLANGGNEFALLSGGSWHSIQSPALQNSPVTLSCTSSTFCLVADYNDVSIFDGSNFSSPTTVEQSQDSPNSVSCPTSIFCMIVDGVGNSLTYNGSTFAAPKPAETDFRYPISSVSCTSSSFCEAGTGTSVSGNGKVLNYSSGTWAEDFGNWNVFEMSCVSNIFCVAAQGGQLNTYDGSTWSQQYFSLYPSLSGVSCTSPTFCVAVTYTGRFSRFNGTTWTDPATFDSASSPGPLHVSCASSTFCIAVDQLGQAFKYNGSTWSSATAIDTSGGWTDGGVLCVIQFLHRRRRQRACGAMVGNGLEPAGRHRRRTRRPHVGVLCEHHLLRGNKQAGLRVDLQIATLKTSDDHGVLSAMALKTP